MAASLKKPLLRYVAAAIFVTLVLRLLPLRGGLLPDPRHFLGGQHAQDGGATTTTCANGSAAMADLAVVVKTGATELKDRLPLPLSTLLHCVPNITILSDFDQTFAGHHILDALDHVSEHIRNTHSDFALYRKLKDLGPDAINASDLTLPSKNNNGNSDNAAWVLDKWKFLPIVDKMVRLRPDAKWFLLIETDTYVSWSNLLRLVAWLDSSSPKHDFIGFPMQLGPTIFAYGGSGTLISNNAARKCSDYHLSHLAELEEYTDHEWAGDCVLGKVMLDAGFPLHWGWPLFNTDSIGETEPSEVKYDKRVWCRPILSFHHMLPEEIRDLYEFETKWEREHPGRTLLYSDLFNGYILPQMAVGRDDWDNLSKDEANDANSPASFEECEALCASRPACLQFSYGQRCLISEVARLGRVARGNDPSIKSGWMWDRIKDKTAHFPACKEDLWL